MSASDYSYLIFVPPFTERSAGVRCLWELAADLRDAGFNAVCVIEDQVRSGGIFESGDAPPIPSTVSYSTALHLVRWGKFVVIYPEVVYGNPLGAPRVVRYVCNRPGLLGGSSRFDDGEKLFVYSRQFLHCIARDVDGVLYKPMLDDELFSPPSETIPRVKRLLYVGKGSYIDGVLDRGSYTEITRAWPARAELPELFRQADHLVSFDTTSLIVYEAALCGCPSVVVPDGRVDEEELRRYELGRAGVVMSFADLPAARATLADVPGNLRRARELYADQLRAFIVKTQGAWQETDIGVTDSLRLRLEQAIAENALLRATVSTPLVPPYSSVSPVMPTTAHAETPAGSIGETFATALASARVGRVLMIWRSLPLLMTLGNHLNDADYATEEGERLSEQIELVVVRGGPSDIRELPTDLLRALDRVPVPILFVPTNFQWPRPLAVVWGSGALAQHAYSVIREFFEVVAIISTPAEPAKWIVSSDTAYVHESALADASTRVIDFTDVKYLVIASQFRYEVQRKCEMVPGFEKLRLLFVSQRFMT
jgi:hypothetical protein